MFFGLLVREQIRVALRSVHSRACGAHFPDGSRINTRPRGTTGLTGIPAPALTAHPPLSGRVNDLRGDDPTQWRTDLPTYAGISYEDLYAGIDCTMTARAAS